MRRTTLAGALALAAAAFGVSAAAADEKAPIWIGDYGDARAASRATGKPIFLVFR